MTPLFAQIGQWLAKLAEPRPQLILLAAGFGLLAITLLILSRTRWGQVRPLSKCVVLSVFVHVLLLAFACGVRLFADPVPVPVPRDPVIQVKLTDPLDEQPTPPEPQPEDPEQPEEPPPKPTEPWNDFQRPPVSAADQPAPTAERLEPEPPPAPTRSAAPPPELPPEKSPLPDVDTTVEPALPAADTVAQTPPPPGPAEDAIPTIQVPRPRRADSPPSDVPGPASPQRLSSPEPAAVAEPSPAPASSAPPASVAPDVQALAELPWDAAQPEAVPADQDDPHRVPEPGTSPGIGPLAAAGPAALVPVPAAAPAMVAGQEIAPRPGSATRLDGSRLPAIYAGRVAGDRSQIVIRNGGTAESEAAVRAALTWLAANQERDGLWNSNRHGGGQETQVLGHDRGGAGKQADNAVTGLAILAFLGNGQTHLQGEYRQTVQRGLEALLRSQAADGNLCGRAELFARMYCHGMATLAISEAYAITGDARLEPYVQRAIGYTLRAQHPTDGGWRYQPGDAGDMSQFGWQLMALKSAELAGLPISVTTRNGMLKFLSSASGGTHGGLAAYRPHGPPTATMTAEAMVCRLFLELRLEPATVDEAVRMIMAEPPQNGPLNLYYWYYATLALFQLKGTAWNEWNTQLQQRLLAAQETTGPNAGSWPTNTVWGGYGGRVYTTAMATLCLEVYYRYLPIFER
jgi:hypothetical protein